MSSQSAPKEVFEPPLDEGIRDAVILLREAGIWTFESCEGGAGHAYPEPTIRFYGDRSEGYRALAVALQSGLSVAALRRSYPVIDGEPTGPYWELTFVTSPDDSGRRTPPEPKAAGDAGNTSQLRSHFDAAIDAAIEEILTRINDLRETYPVGCWDIMVARGDSGEAVVRRPNAETLAAMGEAADTDIVRFESVDDLFAELESDD